MDMFNKWSKNEGVTCKEWRKLCDHKYKYTHILQQMDNANLSLNNSGEKTNKEQLRQHQSYSIQINQLKFFDTLKQLCLYGSWHNNKWYDFSYILKQNELAYFVICYMRRAHGLTFFSIEYFINEQRKKGKSIEFIKLPYTEFREINNYESTHFQEKLNNELNQDRSNIGQRQLNTLMKEFGVLCNSKL